MEQPTDVPSEALYGDLSHSPLSPLPGSDLGGRQRHGPILGRRRNSALPIVSGHQNRAGHRLYVRVNQNRMFRRSILGWGSWRRPADEDRERHVAARQEPNWATRNEPRSERRAAFRAEYRRQRRERVRVGWRKP